MQEPASGARGECLGSDLKARWQKWIKTVSEGECSDPVCNKANAEEVPGHVAGTLSTECSWEIFHSMSRRFVNTYSTYSTQGV